MFFRDIIPYLFFISMENSGELVLNIPPGSSSSTCSEGFNKVDVLPIILVC